LNTDLKYLFTVFLQLLSYQSKSLINEDPVLEERRLLKQVIELLNCTLKRYYKSTIGFGAFGNCQNNL